MTPDRSTTPHEVAAVPSSQVGEPARAMPAASPRLLAVVILLLGALLGGLVEPLSSAHWDSPIYLYQAKRFAETDLARSFATHSKTIAAQLSERSWPESEAFPASFWRFMRFGNIAILGSLVSLADDPMTAIRVAGWGYALLLAAAAALTFLAVCDLGTIFGVSDPRALTIAGAASAFLYLLSPIYWYLSANFLSEIPALFFLSAALFVFARAARTRSLVAGALTGVLVVALYAVRMDSALTALALMVPLTAALRLKAPRYFSYGVNAATALTALLGFAAYSLYFYPLTDPRLVVALRQVLAEGPRAAGVTGYHAVFVAGGLLWIGAAMALVSRRSRLLTALGLVWLLLILLPRVRGLTGTIHARILADLMIPLSLLSAVGLSAVFSTRLSGITSAWRSSLIAIVAVFVLALSLERPYEWLRGLPGLWRLQHAREFVVPPRYERNDYRARELGEIAAVVYGQGPGTVALWDPTIPQEHLNVVRYLGPPYPGTADLAAVPDPTDRRTCRPEDLSGDLRIEPALFCSAVAPGFLERATAEGRRIIVLEPTQPQITAAPPYDVPGLVREELATTTAIRAAALVRSARIRQDG